MEESVKKLCKIVFKALTRRALCDILSYINLHTYIDRGALSQKYPEKMSPRHGEKGRVPKYASLAGRTLAKGIRSVLLSHRVRRAIVKKSVY